MFKYETNSTDYFDKIDSNVLYMSKLYFSKFVLNSLLI